MITDVRFFLSTSVFRGSLLSCFTFLTIFLFASTPSHAPLGAADASFNSGHLGLGSGNACIISITGTTVVNETCPGANDGSITVNASCTSCAGGSADIRYSINGSPFQVSNEFTGLPAGTYTIAIQDVNDPACTDLALEVVLANPSIAADDQYSTTEDQSVVMDVLTNDQNTCGPDRTLLVVTQGNNGIATLSANNTLTYTPDSHFSGCDLIEYAFVDPPLPTTANDDYTSTDINIAVDITVLANDFDPQNDPLTPALILAPANGSAILNGNNTFTYTPNTGFSGVDQFTYEINDGNGNTDQAVVYVNVRPGEPGKLHYLPEKWNGSNHASFPTFLWINTEGPGSATVTISSIDEGTSTVTVSPTSTYIEQLTPGVNQFVEAKANSTTINAVSGHGLKITSDIPVNVQLIQQGGNSNGQSFLNSKSIDALGTKFFAGQFYKGNAYEANGRAMISAMATEDNTTVTFTTPPGSSWNWDGTTQSVVTVTLDANESYMVSSSTAANLITGAKIESDKPIAVSSGAFGMTPQTDNGWDQLVPVERVGVEYVLVRAVSIPDQAFIVATEDNTTIEIDGSVVATIDEGEFYTHSLFPAPLNTVFIVESSNPVYVFHEAGNTANAENGMALIAPIDVNGRGVYRFRTPFIAFSGTVPMIILTATSAVPSMVLTNITDNVTAPLSNISALPGRPDLSLVLVNVAHSKEFRIESNAFVQMMMRFGTNLGGGLSYIAGFSSSTFIGSDDNFIVVQDIATTFSPLGNDVDADGNPITISNFTQPANGTVVDNGDGTFTYTPNTGFTGFDEFSYTITNGQGFFSTASVTLNVISITTAEVEIYTAPVADNINVGAGDVSGFDNQAIALDITIGSSPDTDGSETLGNVVISGVPSSVTLSAGTHDGIGNWTMTPAEAASVTATGTAAGAFNLTVSVENNDEALDCDGVPQSDSQVFSDPFTLTIALATPAAALDFDGVDDKVDIPFLFDPSTTSFTAEAWVKPTSVAGTAHVFMQQAGTGGLSFLGIGSADRFYTFLSGSAVPGTTVVSLNTWYHVAVTWDGTTLRLFVNGVEEASDTPGSLNSSNGAMILGVDKADLFPFQGVLDEVRFWTRALCKEELLNNMNCELTGSETGLLAYYQFNQGFANASNPTETTLQEFSNTYDGTLANFALTGATSNWVEPGAVSTGGSCSAFAIANYDTDACACELGYYATLDGNGNITACTICPAGTYCPDGIDQFDCDAGTFSNTTGATSCTPCAAGYFQSSTGQTECEACLPGKYQPSAGATACLNCEVGTYNPNAAATACQDCPEGTFAANLGQIACETCEPGTEANIMGSACVDCGDPVFNAPCPTLTPVTVNAAPGDCSASVTLTVPALDDDCTRNHALDFDGVDDYAIVSNPGASLNLTGNISFEAWVYVKGPNAYNSPQSILDKTEINDLANYRFFLFPDNRMGFWNGSGNVFSTNSVPTGQWVHLAWVLESGTMTFYTNGVPNGTGSTVLGGINNGPLTIGRDNNQTFSDQRNVNMILDEVRLWNIPRTQAEIQATKDLEINPTYPGLVAFYNFNQGVACCDNTGLTTLPDGMGANDGTLIDFSLAAGCTSNWVAGAPALGDPLTLENDLTSDCSDPSGVFNVGIHTVTWTATGANGNQATCAQTVTVEDNENPVAICPTTAPTVALDGSGNGALAANALAGGNSTDNCSLQSETSPLANFTCVDAPTAMVVLTATDAAGNTNTANCTVNIDASNCCDITITSITPTEVTCFGADDGTLTVTATCGSCSGGGADIRYSIDNSDFSNTTGEFTGLAPDSYTVYVRDINDPSCTDSDGPHAINAGVDNTDPTPVCNDITIQLDATGNYTLTQADIAAIGAGSTDNCTTPANLTLSASPVSFNCSDLNATIPNDYAVETDGVNDYLDMGDLGGIFDFANQATIQVWMRPLSNLSNYQSYVESNNGGAYLSLESGAGANVGKIALWVGGSTAGHAYTANDVITVNQWTNFTAVYDGTQPVMTDRIRIYVNGVQQTLNFSGTVPTAIGNLGDFFMGAQQGISQFANTQYDEVRLWDKALTPAEVAANWNQTIIGNEPGLVAYYAFEDGPGSPTATEIVSGVPAVLNNMDPNTAWVPGASGLTSSSGPGSVVVTLTVTDEATNDATCEAIVTVEDVTPPTITCPANITVTNDPGVCTANVTAPIPLVSDNCLSNRGLNFDGSNDFVDATATSNSSGVLPQGAAPRTMEAWIRTTQTSIGNIISWGRRSGDLRNGMAVRNNKLAFIGQFNDYTSTGVNINDGEWHHVAISFDGTTMRFYVDGALDYSVTTSNLNTTDQNLRLGRISAPDNGEYFNGDMDEVRIWDVALTQPQIQANMNQQLSGTESGLVAYFPMNEGVACSNNAGVTAVPDLTGNSNGTLTNFDLTGTLADPCRSNWRDGAPALGGGSGAASLTNDFNNTDDASDTYPLGETSVTWTATDAVGLTDECTMTITVQSPEILVEGNTVEIANGDTNPVPGNDTDFGDQSTGSTTDRTFTIRNTGATTLNLTGGSPIVDISGAGEFSVLTQPSGTSIAPNGDLTFVVRYAPTSAGSHTATVSIDNDDCDENPYTFDVLGEVLCDISITSFTVMDEVCPGANDGTITVTAACSSCTGGNADIRYSISPDPNNVSPQTSNVFSNLPDGAYTITVEDVNDPTCTDSGLQTINAGVDTENPTFQDNAAITLYDQDFESPNLTPVQDGCFLDLSLNQGVNTLYGPGWQQTYTVETILINGPNGVYTDPTGQGGNYSIGMLTNTAGNDDRLAYTFDAQGKNYLNVQFDLSAIDLRDCASFGVSTPIMRLRLYDSPGGAFNINSPGTLLDQVDLTGIPANADIYTFNWATVAGGLDASGSTDGNVTLMFDLIQSGYASFDNLLIEASDVGVGIGCPAPSIAVECLGDVPAASVLQGFDNCDPNPTVVFNETEVVSNPNDRVITRTWTVTDASGNSNQCVQTVTVDDTQNPTASCPGNQTVNTSDDGTGDCSTTISGLQASGADNCTTAGNLSMTYSVTGATTQANTTVTGSPLDLSGIVFNTGVSTVSVSVTDEASNISTTCSFTVTVNDNELPTVTCPTPDPVVVTSSNGAGDCTGEYTIADPLADNCPGATWDASFSGNAISNPAPVTGIADGSNSGAITFEEGATTVTLSATDAAGNTATPCTFTVTVNDDEIPVITLTGAASVVHCQGTAYTDAGATASDNCDGDLTGSLVVNNPVDQNTAAGTYTVTYDVQDAVGNPAVQVTRTVVVKDPQMATPSAMTDEFCSPGSTPITVAYGADTDNLRVDVSVTQGAPTGYTPSPFYLNDGAQLEANALSNVVNQDAILEYTITPYDFGPDGQDDQAGGDDCIGETKVVTITVKPEPVGANKTYTVCSGTILNVDLQGLVDTDGNGVQSAFSWIAVNNPDVNGENSLPTVSSVINNQLDLVNPGNGPQTVVYTVTPTGLNGCAGDDFTITVQVLPCEITIIDPCACKDNATNLANGQFDETIEVTGPPGDTWTVVLAPGLYLSASPAPPAAPLPVPAGTALTEGPAGVYTLNGIHVDALGYSISVTNGSVTISTSNTCYYPNPSLNGLNATYCSQDGPQVATVSADLGDNSGAATVENILFELIRQSDNAVAASQSGLSDTFNFDPSALAVGLYTLRVTFDADYDAVIHPGCVQVVEETFEVRRVGCGNFPWDGN